MQGYIHRKVQEKDQDDQIRLPTFSALSSSPSRFTTVGSKNICTPHLQYSKYSNHIAVALKRN